MGEYNKKIIQILKQQHLSTDEKSAVQKKLLDYMGLQRNQVKNTHDKHVYLWGIFNTPYMFRSVFSVLCIVILFTSGTLTYAAERSLPGDVFYPIKIHVNENILRTLIILSPESVLSFETSVMEKRLIEAENLEKEDGLNIKNKIVIEEEISEQESRIRNAFTEISANQPVIVSDKSRKSNMVSVTATTTSSSQETYSIKKEILTSRTFKKTIEPETPEKKEGFIEQATQAGSGEAQEHINVVYKKHEDILKKLKEIKEDGDKSVIQNKKIRQNEESG